MWQGESVGDPAWLDRKALAERYSLHSERAVRRLERLGKLPKPSLHLGPRSPRWRLEEVEALFSGRPLKAARSAREIGAEIVQDILKGRV